MEVRRVRAVVLEALVMTPSANRNMHPTHFALVSK